MNKAFKTYLKFGALIFLVSIFGCKNEKVKLHELGQSYNAAWNSQTPEQVASFFAEDGSLIVNKGTPIVGTEAITKFASDFMVAFPDMKLTMDSLVTNNGRTEFHWTFVGTNTGPEGTGNSVNFSGFESWKLNEDGLIIESIGTYDADEYNKQVSGDVAN